MCTLLGMALPRVPSGVLRAKFVGSAQLLSRVVEAHRSAAPPCKAALGCLGQVLAAADPGAWHAAAPGLNLVLAFLTDGRPKVRRRAQTAAAEALTAIQDSPAALAAASEAVVACEQCGHSFWARVQLVSLRRAVFTFFYLPSPFVFTLLALVLLFVSVLLEGTIRRS